ncbi:MAG TPA: FkbM family methyltransferase, partial [Blastocatellia bacterium]
MLQVAQDKRESVGVFSASELQNKVIAANVDFYRQVTHKFDHSESYLFDPAMQQEVMEDLDLIGSYFALLGRTPSCLDCGGGTGNIALKMCARGWNVTVVDVSDNMLGLLGEKASAQGHSPRLVHGPVERFLAVTHETYDLISFSAVLHHLYSYGSVVRAAAKLVRPGGFFYSNQDPVVPKWLFGSRALDSLDIAIAKAMFDRADFLPGIGRRVRKLFSAKDPAFDRAIISSGDLAEYRAHIGVDDEEVIRLLRSGGFEIIDRSRRAGGRTATVQFLNEHSRLQESFKIIARRDSQLRETSRTPWRAEPPVKAETVETGTKRNALRDSPVPESRPPERFWRRLKSQCKYLMAQGAMRRAPFLTLGRLISWRTRCLLRRPAVARMRDWSMLMFLPPDWRGVGKLIFAFRERYEAELAYLEQVLSPGKTFVDAGACYGIYTLAASKLVGPRGRVIAFEPSPEAFRVLRKNIGSNRLTNVFAYRLALAEKKGKASLYLHPNVGCDSLGRDNSFTDHREETAADSLDSVLRALSIKHVDVLKMDVQGAEELVLRGACGILQSCHPLIIFEIFPEGATTLGLAGDGPWDL